MTEVRDLQTPPVHARRVLHIGVIGGDNSDGVFFESTEAMGRVMTPERWSIVRYLQHTPSVLYGLARALGRAPKDVRADTAVLMQYSVLARTPAGRYCVPYDEVIDLGQTKASEKGGDQPVP